MKHKLFTNVKRSADGAEEELQHEFKFFLGSSRPNTAIFMLWGSSLKLIVGFTPLANLTTAI